MASLAEFLQQLPDSEVLRITEPMALDYFPTREVEYEKKGTVVVKIRAGDEYLNAADYDLLSREPVFS